LDDRQACLAHLDAKDLEAQLNRFGRGRPLDARGTSISSDLWQRIIQSAPVDEAGTIRFSNTRFDRATIEGDVDLDGCVFRQNACFHGVHFRGDVSMNGVAVTGQAQFSGAVFEGRFSMEGARLEGPAWFADAQFEGDVTFDETTFWGSAWFSRAAFSAATRLRKVTFEKHASFKGAAFGPSTTFAGANFVGDAEFDDVTFSSPASFEGTVFKGRNGMPGAADRKQTRWWGPPLATWKQRAHASLIDFAVFVAIVAGGCLIALFWSWVQQHLLSTIFYIGAPLAGLVWTWKNLMEQGWSGQTLGKRMVGLRLLSETTRRPVGPWPSVARAFVHTVDSLPLFVGWFRPLRNDKHQTFADTMMGTVVVVVGKNFSRANAGGPAAPKAATSAAQ